MHYFQQIAWQWPQVALTIARALSDGLLILLTALITKWYVKRHIEALLPKEAQEKIREARNIAAFYQKRLEKEEQKVKDLRGIIKSSLATATHTVTNLSGIDE